jgi:putative sporulation protein YtaF
MYDELFLAVIVSFDTLLAAAAYCNSGIKIPLISSAVINLICSAVLGISLCFSGFLSNYIPSSVCRICGCSIIVLIGLLTIVKSIARTLVKRVAERGELSVKLGKSPLALKLCLDDTAADIDHSKVLSASEAAALALASSFDSAAMGLSSGYSHISPLLAFVFTLICGFTAIHTGGLIGKKISSLDHDLSWVGGILLIVFAFIE